MDVFLQMLGEANAELETKLEDMRKQLNEARDEMEKTTDDFLNLRVSIRWFDRKGISQCFLSLVHLGW